MTKQNKCLYIIHSRYYSQWVGSLPFSPTLYWNIVTEDDIIPVSTYGYKNQKSSQQQIKKHIEGIKEYRLIHIESEEEQEIQNMEYARLCVEMSKQKDV